MIRFLLSLSFAENLPRSVGGEAWRRYRSTLPGLLCAEHTDTCSFLTGFCATPGECHIKQREMLTYQCGERLRQARVPTPLWDLNTKRGLCLEGTSVTEFRSEKKPCQGVGISSTASSIDMLAGWFTQGRRMRDTSLALQGQTPKVLVKKKISFCFYDFGQTECKYNRWEATTWPLCLSGEKGPASC